MNNDHSTQILRRHPKIAQQAPHRRRCFSPSERMASSHLHAGRLRPLEQKGVLERRQKLARDEGNLHDQRNRTGYPAISGRRVLETSEEESMSYCSVPRCWKAAMSMTNSHDYSLCHECAYRLSDKEIAFLMRTKRGSSNSRILKTLLESVAVDCDFDRMEKAP